MKKRRPGPPPGTARGELTARESYYPEQAEKVRMANAVRRGELLERDDVKTGVGPASSWRSARAS